MAQRKREKERERERKREREKEKDRVPLFDSKTMKFRNILFRY